MKRTKFPFYIEVIQKSTGRSFHCRAPNRLKNHLQRHGSPVWADCLMAELKDRAGAETAHYQYVNHQLK